MNRKSKRKQAKTGQHRTPSPAPEHILASGLRFHKMGDFSRAERHYRQVLQADPKNPVALNLLGMIAHQVGQNEAALDLLGQAIAHKPDYAEAHFHVGLAHEALNHLEAARDAYRRAADLQQGYGAALNNLGNILQRLGRFDEATEACQAAITAEPNLAPAHNNLGNALYYAGHMEAAVDAFRTAIDLVPRFASAHFNLANALRDLGEMDQAQEHYRQTIAADKTHAKAHRALASIKTHVRIDADVEAIMALLDDPDLSDAARADLHFALGKVFEDLSETTRSFDHIAQGNRHYRATVEYDPQRTRNFFAALKSTFTPEFFEQHRTGGAPDPTPMFIVGMPRSGTSLVEQVLASHPDVYGAGELLDLRQIVLRQFGGHDSDFVRGAANADTAAFTASGQAYLDTLRKHDPNARFITDKMPNNFELVGFIRAMLPQAKIIHCQRDPMDTAWSIFKNTFAGSGYDYAYDQEDLAQYSLLYRDLMAYWQSMSGFDIINVVYEDLVQNPKACVQALLDRCELPWHEACLEFHTTKRAVRTASALQVRQPFYTRAIGAWKKYEHGLQPLARHLA